MPKLQQWQQRWARRPAWQRAVTEATVAALTLAATFLLPRIPQPESYHSFAGDERSFLGVPHFWNVVTNLAIAAPGFAGLRQLWAHRMALRKGRASHTAAGLVCWAATFAGMLAAAAGSARYHVTPTTATLAWDRLGMALTFASLASAVLAERRSPAAGLAALPLTTAAAAAAVLHWQRSEAEGRGDLRAYLLVQGLSAAGVAYLALAYPERRHPSTQPLLSCLALYGAAVAGDRLDGLVYRLALHTVSGHNLKHVLAGVAGWQLVQMMKQRRVVGAQRAA